MRRDCAGVDEKLHRRKGRVRKDVEQHGRRVRAALVRSARRPAHLPAVPAGTQARLLLTGETLPTHTAADRPSASIAHPFDPIGVITSGIRGDNQRNS